MARRPLTLDRLSTARLFRAVRPRIPNHPTHSDEVLSSPAPKDQLVEPLERTALQVLGDGTSMTCHLPVPVRSDSSRAPSSPEGDSGARSSSSRLERRTVSDPVPISSPREMRQPSPGRPRPCLSYLKHRPRSARRLHLASLTSERDGTAPSISLPMPPPRGQQLPELTLRQFHPHVPTLPPTFIALRRARRPL